jgi:8-oxo-dGTP pyrophosphatase MutT (NUDIX family)
MTDLQTHLTRLHTAGHARGEIDLIVNPWTPAKGEFRPSAVLAAVTDRPDPGVLLLYRPETMRSHAGHIALPGGKVDPGETMAQTALREAHEELGIDPATVRLIGPGDMLRTGTFYEMNPIIGIVPADIAITPNPDEVADWFEAPLGHVLDPANHAQEEISIGERTFNVWTIRWNGHRIWGATAMILINIGRRLDWVGNPRR